MKTPRSLSETSLLGYGLLSGGARAVLPAVVDLPVIRTLRGAMFDRMARASGVTLTAGARRILVDLEEPGTRRGAIEQAVRWAAGRLIPGVGLLDGARNTVRTYGAGALFRRYLEVHRAEPRDPVLNELEAERVRAAMLRALAMFSLEQARAVAREAVLPVRYARDAVETSLAQRYGDAVVAAMAELPAAWLDAADATFAAALTGGRPAEPPAAE